MTADELVKLLRNSDSESLAGSWVAEAAALIEQQAAEIERVTKLHKGLMKAADERAERAERELAEAQSKLKELDELGEKALRIIDSLRYASEGLTVEDIESLRPTHPRGYSKFHNDMHKLCDAALAALRMRPSEATVLWARKWTELMHPQPDCDCDRCFVARELLRIADLANKGEHNV